MHKRNLSSGDLIADRRAAYAQALAEAGDYAAAAELVEQALELVPDWAGGWSLLGTYSERAGSLDTAIRAWRRLAELDTEGVFGAGLKLAAHGLGEIEASTDTAFVTALFDDYADRFEQQLLQKLHYAVPEQLAGLVNAELARRGARQVAYAIDLGCGTGLMGERLRGRVSYLVGVDLSANMIGESGRKGIYDALATAELVTFLRDHSGPVDLLAAADVLNYCGALEPVMAAASSLLTPGGLFAFSLEAHGGLEPIALKPSLRFAHEPGAARVAIVSAGFELICFEKAVLRLDRGEPVMGYLVLAAKASAAEANAVVADDDAIPEANVLN